MSRGVIAVMAFLILSSCKVHDIAKREDAIGKSKIQILELGYPFKYSRDRQGRYCLTDRTREGREVFIFKNDTCIKYIAETKSKRRKTYNR